MFGEDDMYSYSYLYMLLFVLLFLFLVILFGFDFVNNFIICMFYFCFVYIMDVLLCC
ncbi:hypothetical protein Lalb_Chr05g0219091 [Lupinus albus]|uniref:Uncharacterized protein n=1 Tax=Lupinus albus TaxID=3870 RepID=A0A6A4QJJ6_LUPAL|nr:hypothetical protein Lalb_Chr05g0219091 [Lupinus albus]